MAKRRATTPYETLGLRDDPFPPQPAVGPYVPLAYQETAIAAIRAWLRQADDAPGIALVTGAAGTGKTRLLERLVLAIAGDDRLIGVVPGACDGARRTDADLIRAATRALGGTPAGRSGLELTIELRTLLDAQRADQLPPVLAIDDAALGGSQLEILRGVMAGPTTGTGGTRVQIVLLGPPALPDRIARRRALAQYVRQVATLPPLDRDAAKSLLEGRIAAMRDVDWPAPVPVPAGTLFADEAIGLLSEAAGGSISRLLDLAHQAVREAIATGRTDVDAGTMRAVLATGHGHAPMPFPATDPAIQTRLVLPELDAGARSPAESRRRGRQR